MFDCKYPFFVRRVSSKTSLYIYIYIYTLELKSSITYQEKPPCSVCRLKKAQILCSLPPGSTRRNQGPFGWVWGSDASAASSASGRPRMRGAEEGHGAGGAGGEVLPRGAIARVRSWHGLVARLGVWDGGVDLPLKNTTCSNFLGVTWAIYL